MDHTHSADISKRVVKTKKCLMHFDPNARIFALSNRQIFFSNLYLCDSIFSSIVWINRLHDFDERIIFLDYCCYEMDKIHFYSDHSNGS